MNKLNKIVKGGFIEKRGEKSRKSKSSIISCEATTLSEQRVSYRTVCDLTIIIIKIKIDAK